MAARRLLVAILAAALGAAALLLHRSLSRAPSGEAARREAAFGAQMADWGVAREQWREMFRSEELIHELTPQLQQLAFSVENLALPDARTRALFADTPAVRDLDPEPFGSAAPVLASAGPGAGGSGELALWRPLLERVDYFHHARFEIAEGRFLSGDEFEAQVAFAGLARMRAGELAALEAKLTVAWREEREPGEQAARWRIARWETGDLRRAEAPDPLFREVLDRALPDPDQRTRARTSIHENLVRDFLLARAAGGRPAKRHGFFAFAAQDRHPGLAVVDFDRDGFDDVYLVARWGANQFFRNRGDGSFEEIAARIGLDVDGHSAAAVFADFDNDGDADLFLGRTLRRSRLFENRGGRYVDRSADAVEGPLPYLASSANAVDVDRDGLLDVYVATYGAAMVAHALSSVRANLAAGRHRPDDPFPDIRFLSRSDARRILALASRPEAHGVLDHPGPPNVLLRNLGDGRFEVVDAGPLAAYRNTYQATWADFDDDGDPDVYLANDFAPDDLLRNDGEGGFSDARDALSGAPLGLAMGATWGDYDRDGRQDLYVTNMYSKAGRRITAQLPSIDPRFREIASGNYLFRNGPGGFERVTGDGGEPLPVERAGWGWGSLFADVDNDGFLDLYALSGFYTAPPAVATAFDT